MEKTAIQYIRDAAAAMRGKKLLNLSAPKVADSINGIIQTMGLECAEQTIPFLVIFEETCSDSYANTNDFCDFYECTTLDAFEYVRHIMRLVELGYVSCTNINDNITSRKFKVTHGVMESLIMNKPICPNPTKIDKQLSRYEFTRIIYDYADDRNCSAEKLFFESNRLEESNNDLSLVKELKSLLPQIKDRVLFYAICHAFVKGNGDRYIDVDDITSEMYETTTDRIAEIIQLKQGTHPLIAANLISFFGNYRVTLTDTGRKLFLEDDYIAFGNSYENLDRYQFAERFNEFVDQDDYSEQRAKGQYISLKRMTRRIEEVNPQLKFISNLQRYDSDELGRVIFYLVAYHCAEKDSINISTVLEKIYCRPDANKKVNEFKEGRHPLQKAELLEVEERSGFFGNYSALCLTDKGKEIFFEEDYEAYAETISDNELKKAADIREKHLFFSPELQSQLGLLRGSLQEGNYQTLTARLEEENLSKGIAVLLYGAPGTGKTESVFQIARETGRDIYHVDISAAKSCWFGESEKLIKSIFKKYKSLCKRSKHRPILLFNEADAIFSKRKDIASSSVAQTENAIQNIILEEMERLDGILVATTNLTENLDPAFERRFLFKVHYDRPTLNTKRSIWMDKLPALSVKDADMLASAYDFSGGEIDNIVRKSKMKELLEGQAPTIEALCQLCNEERISASKGRRIGFVM